MHYCYYLFILILEMNLLHLFLILDSFSLMSFFVYIIGYFVFNWSYLDLFCSMFSGYLYFKMNYLISLMFCLLSFRFNLSKEIQVYLINLIWNNLAEILMVYFSYSNIRVCLHWLKSIQKSRPLRLCKVEIAF